VSFLSFVDLPQLIYIADGAYGSSNKEIGLENRAKLEAHLRSLEAESDATGVRRYNPATNAVGLVSTQREPTEEAVKAVLDVKEEKRRVKRRAENEKAEAAQEAE